MATRLSGMSKQLRTIRTNVLAWCGVFCIVFLLLIVRLFWLQFVCHEYYRKEAARYHDRETVLPSTRGRLLDRNLAVLALDDQRPSLYVDPTLVQAPEFVAQQLASVIGLPEPEILADITREMPFVWVKRHLPPEMCTAIARLPLPELQLRKDGSRYRIGIDVAKAPQTPDFFAALARTLDLSEREIRAQLDMPEQAAYPSGSTAVAAMVPATGQRWIHGIYDEDRKRALQALKLPGLLFHVDSPSYSLGLDPRVFTHQTASLTAPLMATRLAPILNMPAAAVEAHLQSHPRFVWIKRNLSPAMALAITRMQGTVYVVNSGPVPAVPSEFEGETVEVEQSVNRLYQMLNPKGAPQQISRETIRCRLLPGAAPGPLGVKLVNGQPSVLDERSLLAKPIPGVVYGLAGVSLQHERRRSYPFNSLASATLGFVSYNNHLVKGAFGLERAEEKTLRGIDGREIKEVDARHITIPEHSQRVEPVDGFDVKLTLDLSIQQAAEEEVHKAVEKAHAVGGECLVMDPNNGEILAMASAPSWNSNAPATCLPGAKPLPLINPIVSNFYEPGSTFKVATVMAALEEGVIHDGDTVTYCSGAYAVGNKIIHESHNAHGQVDCGRLLEQSCNIGAANLSLRLGAKRFLKWCRTLGFGQRTGIEVPNESPGYLNAHNVAAKITLANMGFGQSLAVTPLQMLAAYSTVANGGFLVKPHVVMARMRRNGVIEATPIAHTSVCSPGTAELIRGYLERVVTQGTGKLAAIPGYRVAGKTGTAQKPGKHGYHSGAYISSFIGFMPVEKPRLIIIAIIDEPHAGSIFGALNAAPVVQAVGQRALQYMNILPTQSSE